MTALIVVTAAALVAVTQTQAATPTQNANAVYRAFAPFGPSVAAEMVRCMWRESHGNEKAANWGDSNGGSYGLLQLNGVHRWRGETIAQFRARMWSVASHLEAAVRLFRSSGFAPWGRC